MAKNNCVKVSSNVCTKSPNSPSTDTVLKVLTVQKRNSRIKRSRLKEYSSKQINVWITHKSILPETGTKLVHAPVVDSAMKDANEVTNVM